MRIGFDAKKIVSNLTGIGNYSRNIINGLSAYPGNRYVLFAPHKGTDQCVRDLKESASVSFVYPSAHSSFGQEWWRCRGIIEEIVRQQIDIFHGLSNELPMGLHKTRCKSVVTIHDLIFLRHPEYYSLIMRQILKAKTYYACRHADKIIAISRQTKQDIMNFYHIPESKIEIVYQGCNPAFHHKVSEDALTAVRKSYQLPSRYILCVGTIEPRKNQLTLVRILPKLREDIHLVLIGKATPYQHAIEEEACKSGMRNRVQIFNRMPNCDLPAIYQGSTVFASLSFFEGFGIPVLEAITSGVPVIAATGSCLEEAGGPDSIYCDPTNLAQIADRINELLACPERRAHMIQAGLKYASRFSESAVTGQLLSVYRQLLQQE